MKILFLHPTFATQFSALATALASDPRHEVVAIAERGIVEAPLLHGVRYQLYEKPLANFPGVAPPAAAMLSNFHRAKMAGDAAVELGKSGFFPDLVIAHMGPAVGLLMRDIFPGAKILGYCEFITRWTGNTVNFDPEFPSPIEDAIAAKLISAAQVLSLEIADWFVAPTQWQKLQFPAAYRSMISVIHDGVPTDAIAPDPRATFTVANTGITVSPADEVVTFTSRSLEPMRGFHTFMRALPEIQRRRPGAHIIIAGKNAPTYSRELPEGQTYRGLMLRELDGRLDTSRVHFVGKLPRDQYLRLLQVSTAHVHLVVPFTLSYSCTDAMAAGCLVIGSRTPPIQEVISDRRNGFLVDFFAPDQLAEAVVEALRDREDLRPLREAARRTVIERFDLTRVCLPQYMRLIDAVMTGRTGDRPRISAAASRG